MHLRVWDVEHGACAMVQHLSGGVAGRLAMIDSGSMADWRPSEYITKTLGRNRLDYLFITNADQDHMSDLQGLWDAGIQVGNFYGNPSYSGAQYRAIKRASSPLTPLTDDALRYAALCDAPAAAVSTGFNDNMGGITQQLFWPNYPYFTNTNDLSMAVFLDYNGFKILFPGDLEKPGWRALLTNQDFKNNLAKTEILVASHHGRENGFCPEVFDYCKPSAVIISDKEIEHETQETVPDYRAVVSDVGVKVRTTGKTRHVLTTRRDGWIHLSVTDRGVYFIDTECEG